MSTANDPDFATLPYLNRPWAEQVHSAVGPWRGVALISGGIGRTPCNGVQCQLRSHRGRQRERGVSYCHFSVLQAQGDICWQGDVIFVDC